MLALNDEALRRLTAENYEGKSALARTTSFIPIFRRFCRFAADFPHMKIVGVVAHENPARNVQARRD
jgi:hypothetical protein